MICINLIFKYGETLDKNKIVDYIKNVEKATPILERIKGLDDFFSIKYIDKSIDTIVRVIDITKCRLDFEDMDKILKKLTDKAEIDRKTNLYCFSCSAKEPGSKISSLIEEIKNDIKDDYALFITDKYETNRTKIDSIVLKCKDTFDNSSLVFIDDLSDNNLINIARRMSGINLLRREWERYRTELLKSFDEYVVKSIYINVNKIKLKNRSEMFKKEEGDLTNNEVLDIKKKYVDMIIEEINIIETAINNLLDSYRTKFKFKEGKFEVLNYQENLELEYDGSKISNLYKDLMEKKRENKKSKIISLFKSKNIEEDTNTEELEKFIIEESFKNKLNLQKSMDNFKREYLYTLK